MAGVQKNLFLWNKMYVKWFLMIFSQTLENEIIWSFMRTLMIIKNADENFPDNESYF